ncbi:hypothetical protein LguiB_016799 [Lonicera macranthoides]
MSGSCRPRENLHELEKLSFLSNIRRAAQDLSPSPGLRDNTASILPWMSETLSCGLQPVGRYRWGNTVYPITKEQGIDASLYTVMGDARVLLGSEFMDAELSTKWHWHAMANPTSTKTKFGPLNNRFSSFSPKTVLHFSDLTVSNSLTHTSAGPSIISIPATPVLHGSTVTSTGIDLAGQVAGCGAAPR